MNRSILYSLFSLSQESEDTDTTVSVGIGSDTSSEDLEMDSSTGMAALKKIKRSPVKNILKGSMEGRAVLKTYRKTKTLSRRCSNIIVSLVISEIFRDSNR